MRRVAAFVEANLNAGEARHGAIGWILIVGSLSIIVWLVWWLLASVNFALAWAWNCLVLYMTLGFRQFSHHFTDIHLALRMGEVERARQLLKQWRGRDADDLGSSEICRLSIEEGLKASHRHVFAVIFWYALLPGPCGAVIYRAGALLAEVWGEGKFAAGPFGAFARQAFAWIDWLPQRVTATAFAIVGDFEDAIYCWRTQAARWSDEGMGVILASGAGALGVRLGMPVVESGEVNERADLGIGEEADVDFMQSAVGMVWRALVLWLLLLFMLSLARWVGG